VTDNKHNCEFAVFFPSVSVKRYGNENNEKCFTVDWERVHSAGCEILTEM